MVSLVYVPPSSRGSGQTRGWTERSRSELKKRSSRKPRQDFTALAAQTTHMTGTWMLTSFYHSLHNMTIDESRSDSMEARCEMRSHRESG